jgi:hypothetical protein
VAEDVVVELLKDRYGNNECERTDVVDYESFFLFKKSEFKVNFYEPTLKIGKNCVKVSPRK